MPTSYEIYQTYLRGPAAVLRLFKQALGTQAIYGRPDPGMQQRTIENLSEEIDALQSQIVRLKEELRDTRGDNNWLRQRNAELEALSTKDSHNSSRPPSTDPPWRKRTRSLRRPSGKRPGGQVGHPGHTLRLTHKPTRVVRHRPKQCHHCLSPLREERSTGVERRQVIDLVPIRLRVTEHRAEVVRCSRCGRKTKAELFPESVREGCRTALEWWRVRSIYMTISCCPTRVLPRRCENCSAARFRPARSRPPSGNARPGWSRPS